MEINPKFWPTQQVELIHDPEHLARMVTQMFISPNGGVRYELSCGDKASVHYEEEMKAHIEGDSLVGFRIIKQP